MESAGMIQASIEKDALEINERKYDKLNYKLIIERGK